jgi:hypothetical protein
MMTEDATSAADTSPETMCDSFVKDEELETAEEHQATMSSHPAESNIKSGDMPQPILKAAMPPPAPKSAMAPPPPKCSSNLQTPIQKETAYTRPEWSGCPSAEEFPYFFEVNHFSTSSASNSYISPTHHFVFRRF